VRPLAAALVAALLLIAGCGADDPEGGPGLGRQLDRLEGAPPELAALHKQANQLVDGGPDAFKAQVEKLRGHPIVVNKWASWCAPCRQEFPVFQRVGTKLGKRVAFIGVDSDDNDGNARDFLANYPVSYPSYKDPDSEVAKVFNAGVAFPSTAFYDPKGDVAFVHQGPYTDDAALVEDIKRYGR